MYILPYIDLICPDLFYVHPEFVNQSCIHLVCAYLANDHVICVYVVYVYVVCVYKHTTA